MILLPGNGYTGASTFVSGGSAAVLAGVTNPDKSTTNLVFDVHQYLDTDGSGTSTVCVKTSEVLAPLRNWLKSANRQALLSETGGGSETASCITNVCEVLDFLNENSDQFLGYLGWSAGSFDSTYVLSLVPEGGKDQPLMEKCFAAKFGGGAGTNPAAPVPSSKPETAPPSSPAAGGAVAPPSSSNSAPAQSATSAQPTITSAPAANATLQLPSSALPSPTTSHAPYGLQYGQPAVEKAQGQAPNIGDNFLMNGADEQDDCDAEWEDVPEPPEPSTVTKRNGKARLSYAEEI